MNSMEACLDDNELEYQRRRTNGAVELCFWFNDCVAQGDIFQVFLVNKLCCFTQSLINKR